VPDRGFSFFIGYGHKEINVIDELTSAPAPEEPQGQAEGQAEGAPSTTEDSPAQRDKFNLFENEDFRRVQSNWQSKQDQLAAELAEERRARQELEEKDLDDFDKLKLHNSRLQQAVQAREQYIEKLERGSQLQQQKDADLAFISNKFDVPVHELRNAETYEEAVDLAKSKFEQAIAAKYQPKEDDVSEQTQTRPQEHRPFLGSSKPSKSVSKIDKRIDEAETTQDLIRLWYDTGD
jgi:signal transduction histidine kinase